MVRVTCLLVTQCLHEHLGVVMDNPPDCQNGLDDTAGIQDSIFSNCSLAKLPSKKGETIEILVTVNYPTIPLVDSQIYLGMTTSVTDILTNAEPIVLGPGSRLHGLSSIIVKQRLSNVRAAALGFSAISKVSKVSNVCLS